MIGLTAQQLERLKKSAKIAKPFRWKEANGTMRLFTMDPQHNKQLHELPLQEFITHVELGNIRLPKTMKQVGRKKKQASSVMKRRRPRGRA